MSVPLKLGIILLLACCVATWEVRRIRCEHRKITLYCGFSLINVTSANYGRTNNRTCSAGRPISQVTNTNCTQNSSLSEVAKRCDGKTRCSVLASNSVFSDPCVGTFKFLDVSFTCIPRRRIITCQGYYAVPWCVAGNIRIDSAVYGRRNNNLCSSRRPWWQTRNTRCARNVTSTVAARCNGNRWCFIKVSNSVFGDPCRGTYKYLDVTFSCLT